MLRSRIVPILAWLTLAGVALYFYVFRRDAVQLELQSAFSGPLAIAGAAYLLLGCLRAFTLIPSTYLVLAGLPFFPPTPLLLLTLAGIGGSSSIIYWFAESLHLKQIFEGGRHRRHVDWLGTALEKHQLPVIIGWSFFPLVPTDLICYVCGALDVNFRKFILGVLIGEGAICAIYIYLGGSTLRLLLD